MRIKYVDTCKTFRKVPGHMALNNFTFVLIITVIIYRSSIIIIH